MNPLPAPKGFSIPPEKALKSFSDSFSIDTRFGLFWAIGAGLGLGVGFGVLGAVGDLGQAFEQLFGGAVMAFDDLGLTVSAMDFGVQHEAVAPGAIGAGLEVLVTFVAMYQLRLRRRYGVTAGTVGILGHLLSARRTSRHRFDARRLILLLATSNCEQRRDHQQNPNLFHNIYLIDNPPIGYQKKLDNSSLFHKQRINSASLAYPHGGVANGRRPTLSVLVSRRTSFPETGRVDCGAMGVNATAKPQSSSPPYDQTATCDRHQTQKYKKMSLESPGALGYYEFRR